MSDRVYVETTFVSYLTAWPSRDIVIAAHQQITHQWWNTRRESYELCIAEPVLEEAVNRIPYLLTWNCRHLANATMRPMIESVCAAKGFKAPIICTPEELMEAKES